MSGQEMPIFTRTFDFLTWLLPVTNHFPRAHRHTFTRRLLDAAFDLRERLQEANVRQSQARLERLLLADLRLTIHPASHPRPVTEGIPFLGFVVYPQQRRLKRREGYLFSAQVPASDRRLLRRGDGAGTGLGQRAYH